MDKYVGLRFNFKNGSFFQIKLERSSVDVILLKFKSGQDEVVGGCDPDNTIWSMRLADVSFIHSFDWQQYEMQLRMQQLGQAAGVPPGGAFQEIASGPGQFTPRIRK